MVLYMPCICKGKFRMKCVEKYDASTKGAENFWICQLITTPSYEM